MNSFIHIHFSASIHRRRCTIFLLTDWVIKAFGIQRWNLNFDVSVFLCDGVIRYSGCPPKYVVQNAQEEPIFMIDGPICICRCICCPTDIDFHVRLSLLSMRCSDVINVTVVTRRHVGSMLSVNTDLVKCWNTKILVPRLFADRVFRLGCNSTHNSLQAKFYDVTLLQQVYLQHRGT